MENKNFNSLVKEAVGGLRTIAKKRVRKLRIVEIICLVTFLFITLIILGCLISVGFTSKEASENFYSKLQLGLIASLITLGMYAFFP